MAYWAIGTFFEAAGVDSVLFLTLRTGLETATDKHRNEVNLLISKMFALRPMLHIIDQEPLNMYLSSVHRLYPLTYSSKHRSREPRPSVPTSLATIFDAYTAELSSELRAALGTVKYLVDAEDTLELILNSRRLESVSIHFIDTLMDGGSHILTCRN